MKAITHYIDIEKLTAPVNNLEAIVLLSTGKEEQALKDHFIDQVIINTDAEDTDRAKDIDFYIYTTNLNTDILETVELSHYTYPDLELCKAITMSSAFPLMFEPICDLSLIHI